MIYFYVLKSFETKLLIKKVIKNESTIYALGNLKESDSTTMQSISSKTNNNKQILENASKTYSLFKFYIDESLKNSTEIEHKLVLSDINLNADKLGIAIDNEVT